MTSSLPKAERQETPAQLRTWAEVRSLYLRAGLCQDCAAQAAWGHQLGFGYRSPRPWPEADRSIKAPCSSCKPVIDRLPVAATPPSPWRRFRDGRGRE